MRKVLTEIPRIGFRLALAAIFLYFGILGIQQPLTEAARWMPSVYQEAVSAVAPLRYVVMGFGVLEIMVAVMLAIGAYLRWSLLAAAIMLILIIGMLGVSEIALRDMVILIAIAYYASREVYHRY